MAHSHSLAQDSGKIIGIAAIAAISGALIATILTPRSGRETRQLVRNQIKKGLQSAPINTMKGAPGDVEKVVDPMNQLHEVATKARTVHRHLKQLRNDLKEGVSKPLDDDEADHIRRNGER